MKKQKTGIIWTKEYCLSIALTCKTRKELSEKSRTCYTTSHRKGWLNEICSHMTTKKRAIPNYWTRENCRAEALKHDTRGQFEKNSLGGYTKARRMGWLDEICSHMHFRQRGVEGRKKVYALIWTDLNKIYVGITNNPSRRIKDHIENSSNSKVQALISSGSLPKVEIVTDWLNFKNIVDAEQNFI